MSEMLTFEAIGWPRWEFDKLAIEMATGLGVQSWTTWRANLKAPHVSLVYARDMGFNEVAQFANSARATWVVLVAPQIRSIGLPTLPLGFRKYELGRLLQELEMELRRTNVGARSRAENFPPWDNLVAATVPGALLA